MKNLNDSQDIEESTTSLTATEYVSNLQYLHDDKGAHRCFRAAPDNKTRRYDRQLRYLDSQGDFLKD